MRWGRLFSRAWLNYQRIFCCLGVCWQDQRLIILLVVGQDMQITYNAVSIRWFGWSKGQHKMYIVLKGSELLLKISYISFTRCPDAFIVHIYTQMGLKASIKITKLLFLMQKGAWGTTYNNGITLPRFLVLKGPEVYIFDRGPVSVEDWCQGKPLIKYKVYWNW